MPPTSTAAVHASSTATTRHHYPRLTGSSSEPTQPAAKHRQAKKHYNTDTSCLSGDTQRHARLGAPL